MTIKNRLAKLEAQTLSPDTLWTRERWEKFNHDLWLVYGTPGQPMPDPGPFPTYEEWWAGWQQAIDKAYNQKDGEDVITPES